MTFEQLNERIKTISDEVNMRSIDLRTLEDLLENARVVDNNAAQIHIIAALGQYYYYKGNTKKSFDYMFDSYALATEIENPEALVKAQSNLGAVYVSLGLYEHAFQYLMMALKGVENYNLNEKIGVLNINIGSCLFKQDMFEEAGKYFKLAYESFKNQENPYYKLFSLLNMAAYNMRIGEFNAAERYLDDSKTLQDQLPPTMICGIESSYARLKAYRGDIDGSLDDMNNIYDKYFSSKVELILYDQIIDWCHVLEQSGVGYYAKSILEKVTDDLNDDKTAATAELMLLLANLYEADRDYEKSSKLLKESIKIKSDLYKKNQQFITENTLKLIEMTKKNKEIARRSYRDAMTGCLNRHALDENGQQVLTDTYNNGKNIAVIMFDIDYFKQYNDHYGHLKGDICINEITNAIMSTLVDEERYFYRYGGDEFLILWPLVSDGPTIAKEMLHHVRSLKLKHDKSIISDHVTISIGISTLKDNNLNLRNAIDAADMNLYKAKFSNRNCACIDENRIE